jgi:hypothetical protein
MRVYRLGFGVLSCVLFAAPAIAQMPPYPGPAGAPDLTCLCLKQSVDDLNSDMNAKNGELGAAQAEVGRLDAQLAAARSKEDATSPQSVAAFRQLLAQRDAAFRQSNGDLIAAAQVSTARYNQAVANYNTQCTGRPLPPPPPGPLTCVPAR